VPCSRGAVRQHLTSRTHAYRGGKNSDATVFPPLSHSVFISYPSLRLQRSLLQSDENLPRARVWFPPPRPAPSPPRTKWTRRVPHPVLIGHAASLTPYSLLITPTRASSPCASLAAAAASSCARLRHIWPRASLPPPASARGAGRACAAPAQGLARSIRGRVGAARGASIGMRTRLTWKPTYKKSGCVSASRPRRIAVPRGLASHSAPPGHSASLRAARNPEAAQACSYTLYGKMCHVLQMQGWWCGPDGGVTISHVVKESLEASL